MAMIRNDQNNGNRKNDHEKYDMTKDSFLPLYGTKPGH